MIKINPKYVAIGTSMLGIGLLVYFLNDVVAYILIAWVISMIGAPVMSFLRPKLGRSAAAIATLSLFLVLTAGAVWFFVPPFVNQVQALSAIDYSKLNNTLNEPIKDWENWLVSKNLMLPAVENEEKTNTPSPETDNIHTIVLDSVYTDGQNGKKNSIQINVHLPEQKSKVSKNQGDRNFFSVVRSGLTSYVNPIRIQQLVNGILNNVSDLIIAIFSIFFISFFFLREQGLFVDMIKATVPSAYEFQTVKVIDETSKLLIKYFLGIVLQVTIITVLISTSLLVLGIKNALLIGVLAGMLNIIPYLGPLIAAILAAFITITSHLDGSFYDGLVPTLTKLAIVFFIVRLIDDFILQPNIFSKSVKAHPLEIFLVVLIGAKLGGVMGTLLALPLYTAIRVFGKNFFSEFKIVKLLTKNLQ